MKWHQIARGAPEETRHVLGISGGKDSAALAIHLKKNYPDLHEKIEYFFTDTGAELEEVYEFLDRLEIELGKKVKRLNHGKDFRHYLTKHNNMLPSPQRRWCTQMMKIKPFEAFVGDDPVISYVGIRADENREGYISRKESIKALFPFMGDGLVREDVFRILEETVGIPEYYQWRSRSGCFFCFFQRQDEWLGLKRKHPRLFEEARKIEQTVHEKGFDWGKVETIRCGEGYTWSQSGTLDEIIEKAEENERNGKVYQAKKNVRWQDTVISGEDEDPEDQACLICSL